MGGSKEGKVIKEITVTMLLIQCYIVQVILKYMCVTIYVYTYVFQLHCLYNNSNQPKRFSYLL